jgi:hypothetical protein
MQHRVTPLHSHKSPSKTGYFICLSLFLTVFFLTPSFSASTADAATAMKHTAPDYFVSDQRIQLEAQVDDPAGVSLVRCYFKAAGEANMVFVSMNSTGKDEYTGILPAPSATTDKIEYLFLAVNSNKEVVRSQTFTITKDENQKTPAWQEVPKQGEIKVSMELDKIPTQLRGFSDNVTIDMVESGARFGVVALLYHSAANSSTKSVLAANSATGATSGGTITAAPAGWATSTIVWAGVGAAAVIGGTVAAVSGGGGGGGGGSDDNNGGGGGGTDDLTSTTILGYWNFEGNRRDGVRRTGDMTFNADGSQDYTVTDADGQSNGSGTGTWTLSGTFLTITFQTMSTWSGTATGNSDAFTLDTSTGSNHGTYEFTR